MRVLLVEDDDLLGAGIYAGVQHAGHAVDWVKDGEMAETAMATEPYELVILDLGLPKKSGLEVLEAIRAQGNETPVLILTARDTVDDRVAGLDKGADDYLVKPFDLDELLARMRALARRRNGRATPVLTHGDIVLNPAAHWVKQGERDVDLSPREFAVLQTLLENAGRVLSRSRLEESLYSWKNDIESNAVEVHIHHLRKKLGKDLIRTIRGVGYMVEKCS